MIKIILTMISLVLCIVFVCMAEYKDSIPCAIISVAFGILTIIGFIIITEDYNKEQDIQYQKDVLDLKLIEQRIELLNLQIEKLKLNINQK